MGKLKSEPQEVRQPLARVGEQQGGRGGQGQGRASGSHAIKDECTVWEVWEPGMRVGWRGCPGSKGKGAFWRRVGSAVSWVSKSPQCPAQSLAHSMWLTVCWIKAWLEKLKQNSQMLIETVRNQQGLSFVTRACRLPFLLPGREAWEN